MKNYFRNWLHYFLYLCAVITLIVSAALLIPYIQSLIIKFGVSLAGRPLNVPVWIERFCDWSKHSIFIAIIFAGAGFLCCNHAFALRIRHEVAESIHTIDFKNFLKPVLILWGLLSIISFSLLRANFSYADDLHRAVEGGIVDSWGRYVAGFLSQLMNASPILSDISPLPQILALFILSVSTVVFINSLCGQIKPEEIKPVYFLCVIPLTLSPWFLENLSYKFDAPYMAISIFASITPFLFKFKSIPFSFFSVVGLLIMCTTYQASSGIYIMMTTTICFQMWKKGNASYKTIALFALRSAILFAITLGIYKIFLVDKGGSYMSTQALPVSAILPGIVHNVFTYGKTIYADCNLIWKIAIVLVALLFIIGNSYSLCHKHIASLVVSLLMLTTLFIFSFGAYIVLQKPLFSCRAVYGFGVFLAILSLDILNNQRNNSWKIGVCCIIILDWCFVSFASEYGNALTDQKRYTDFRGNILIQDLSELFPSKNKTDMKLQLQGNIGFSPVVQHDASIHPIIKRLVPIDIGEAGDGWTLFYLLEYYNWNTNHNANRDDKPAYQDFTKMNLPTLKSTYYHTIKSDGKNILIILYSHDK
ncbi:MAG: glucosyltransferase domain-containing protein [Spirochaetaceae bacterium]|jgi:hypothetical protein|nr:glucosyltransferase domain-containing protein [Spirochaetaceae bacterium]